MFNRNEASLLLLTRWLVVFFFGSTTYIYAAKFLFSPVFESLNRTHIGSLACCSFMIYRAFHFSTLFFWAFFFQWEKERKNWKKILNCCVSSFDVCFVCRSSPEKSSKRQQKKSHTTNTSFRLNLKREISFLDLLVDNLPEKKESPSKEETRKDFQFLSFLLAFSLFQSLAGWLSCARGQRRRKKVLSLSSARM